MKVTAQDTLVKFEDLRAGECFSYGGLTYMKTNNVELPLIDLASGNLLAGMVKREDFLVRPVHRVVLETE